VAGARASNGCARRPYRFWLYVVDNVSQGDPKQFRLLRFGGAKWANMLAGRKERRYFEIPFPVGTYDAAVGDGATPPS
jgi:hypothetical protein